jgi:hypothetical protein
MASKVKQAANAHGLLAHAPTPTLTRRCEVDRQGYAGIRRAIRGTSHQSRSSTVRQPSELIKGDYYLCGVLVEW